MKIRTESWPWLAGSGLPAVVFYSYWLCNGGLIWLGLFLVATVLTVFFTYFFRDPERDPESEDPRDWVSPADGIVHEVDRSGNGCRLVIFLTVFNVHLNRLPVAGRVEEVNYTPGQFLPAFADDLDQKNERNVLKCVDEQGRSFEVWQIAGLLARRIHSWVEPGAKLERGQRFGMIALGSRTDLVLPPEVKPVVETGEVVRAGQTTVAKEANDVQTTT